MTPLAQVWHVFVKDLRQQRWLVLLYLLLVVAAVGHALSWRPFANGAFGGSMVMLGFVIVLLVASVIQGDSPTRSDAFWASHPFEPLAVLGAKVLTAIALLAVAVIGQVVVLRSYDATSADTMRLIVDPLLALGAVMLAAAVIASLTRDLRTFIVAVIVTPVVMALTITLITAYAREGSAFRLDGWIVRGARTGALVFATALIPWLYRTRDNRWKVRVVSFFTAGVVAITTLAGSAVRSAGATATTEAKGAVPHFALSAEIPPGGVHGDPDQLSVEIVMPPLPEQLRLAVVSPVATLRFGDGTTSGSVPLGASFTYQLLGDAAAAAARPSIPGIRWLAGEAKASVAKSTVTGVLTPEQRMRLGAKGAMVVIDATVRVDTIEAGAPIRLGAGSSVRHAGRRLVIQRWSHYGGTPEIIVRTAGLDDDPPYVTGGGNEYALLNRGRSEALPLVRADLEQNIDGLVLPGTTAWRTTARLAGAKGGSLDSELPGDAWYDHAELLPVVTRTLGSYPVRFTLAIPPR